MVVSCISNILTNCMVLIVHLAKDKTKTEHTRRELKKVEILAKIEPKVALYVRRA